MLLIFGPGCILCSSAVFCGAHFNDITPEDYLPGDMIWHDFGRVQDGVWKTGAGETGGWSGAFGAHGSFIRSAVGAGGSGRKRQLCTVSLCFLMFANFQMSPHNGSQNEKRRVISINCCKAA